MNYKFVCLYKVCDNLPREWYITEHWCVRLDRLQLTWWSVSVLHIYYYSFSF